MKMQKLGLPLLVGLSLVGCADQTPLPLPAAPLAPVAPATASTAPAPAPNNPQGVDRMTFNRRAAELNLPLYWVSDTNNDRAIQADELKALLFYPTEGHWVENGALTRELRDWYGRMTRTEEAAGPKEDAARRALVREDLAQGATTLIYTDLKGLGAGEKEFVRHILSAAKAIDGLYAAQKGIDKVRAQVPPDDPASQSLFRRNWGPSCFAPATEKNPACSAIPGAPKVPFGIYPEAMQKDPNFCKMLEAHKESEKLLGHFVVVREVEGKLTPVPYSSAFRDGMEEVSRELKAAADAVTDSGEAALKAYLLAASKSFLDNDWAPADAAWAAMTATNSKWYLRVAPDETYFEPCDHKAGFHLQLARINRDSLAWQEKLSPVRTDMENTLAKLIGKDYKARDVSFHLPDFIEVVVNAGDARMPIGGLAGESLPNWGKITEAGGGRTVAMTNMFRDPDSLANRKAQAASLFTADTMAHYSDEALPGLLSTILHEATHNLGPTHKHKVNKKTDEQAFGGPMSSMMEELKAQSGGLFYVEYTKQKGLIDPELAMRTYTDAIVWAFGHIARGMYDENHKSKAYGHLAAIQLGFLMDQGAVTWDANQPAANGTDKGAFTIHFDKMPAASEALMKKIGTIKATFDAAAATALTKQYVDSDVVPQKVIADREARFPRGSFVYAVDL